jgi:hypothetical protein
MPQASGPKQTAKENLIFAYDIGDVKNSYAGEPTTNILGFDASLRTVALGNQVFDSVQFGSSATCQVVEFDGRRAVAMDRGNSSGVYYENRCYIYKSVEIGEYVSWSAWVYSVTGGQQLRIEFYGGDYTWSVAQDYNTHTGTGWERLYARTLYPATSYADVYAFIYANTDITFYVRDLQIEKRQYPATFTNGTRSTTQALKPIVSNTTIDLSNVSFDANAQIIFDGTNDKINLGLLNITNTAFTYETVIKTDSITGGYSWILGKAGYNMGLNRYDNYLKFFLYDSSNNLYSAEGGTLNTTSYFHVVGVYTGLNLQLYVNGVLINTSGAISTPKNYDGTDTYIGTPNGSSLFYQGQIPVAKVYNKALTATEIQQNYKSYKTRFKLS